MTMVYGNYKQIHTLVGNINIIGTEFVCLIVKRLCNITDKVDDEL